MNLSSATISLCFFLIAALSPLTYYVPVALGVPYV